MKPVLTKADWQAFDDLGCRMSPENLTCDGELSRKEVAVRMRQIKAEWKALEKKVGRKVFAKDIPMEI